MENKKKVLILIKGKHLNLKTVDHFVNVNDPNEENEVLHFGGIIFNSLTFLVLREICGETSRYSLQENMHRITAPLQVIWGKEDQVMGSQ